jgi:hypothetical protein
LSAGFVVAGESAVEHQPTDCPLDHPSPLEDVEASDLGVRWTTSALMPIVAACSTNWFLKPVSTLYYAKTRHRL